MSAGTSVLFSLMVCFLVRSSEALKMTGAEKITAVVGQNVTLPCEVPNNNNINKTITAVKWIRPDQEGEYILYYHDRPSDPVSHHPCYKNRVDLQDKEMKDGDASMILKNVKMEDTGTYECWVPQRKNNEPISIINLEVHPPDNHWKTSTIVLGVFLGAVILSAVGFAVYKILQIRKMKKEKKEKQEVIEQRNNSETSDLLQQKARENEALKNELEKEKKTQR